MPMPSIFLSFRRSEIEMFVDPFVLEIQREIKALDASFHATLPTDLNGVMQAVRERVRASEAIYEKHKGELTPVGRLAIDLLLTREERMKEIASPVPFDKVMTEKFDQLKKAHEQHSPEGDVRPVEFTISRDCITVGEAVGGKEFRDRPDGPDVALFGIRANGFFELYVAGRWQAQGNGQVGFKNPIWLLANDVVEVVVNGERLSSAVFYGIAGVGLIDPTELYGDPPTPGP